MTMGQEAIEKLVADVQNDVVKWRRHLHQNPELSFHEVNTSQFIYDTLSGFAGLELSRPTKTSVMARLFGSKPGKTLAIRADMDALPILEATDLPFKSQNDGVMHACGHDGHTAMLLGTAKILSSLQQEIQGEVRFLFQHAEEVLPGGAQEMVKAGVMDGVDMIIGIHLGAQQDAGTIEVAAGPVHASPDTFHITIIGKGGHAAHPNECIDSVAIAGQVVTNLQHIASRYTDPLENIVLSVTQIKGGTADNIIPGSVDMMGTVRTYKSEIQEKAIAWMERIIKGVTEAHGASYKFSYEKGYLPVINDEALTAKVTEGLLEAFGPDIVKPAKPSMGGEDFSAFQQKAPGTFFFVGAGNPQAYPHHHEKFVIDEISLPMGVKSFVSLTFKLLGEA